MDVVERSIRSWIASEKDVEIEKLVEDISTGSVTLLDIVKALGEYLTSEEDHLRTKGVQVLSLVIERCPRDKFNRQTVRVLTSFYCSKLEDTETITPALSGLSHLVTFPSFSSLEVSDVLSAIFRHVKMQSLVQPTRLYVYIIVDTLVHTHPELLKNMGEQFLSGYATLASGERDPRNLLIAFKIAYVILTDFEISGHVESYFDIIFCYYPITFRPPPNDPHGINIDDLKRSLRACLSATPAFGNPGMTLFLEKLANGPLIKQDVLQTMSVCFPVYGIGVARELGRKIWSALKLEIFQPTDPLTQETALDALRAFVQVLQENSSDNMDDVDAIVHAIRSDSLESIGEPEKQQARAGIKVLCALLDVPSKLRHSAIKDAINKLTGLFHDPGEFSNRAAVIMLFTDLLNTFGPSETVTSESSVASKRSENDYLSLIPPLLTPYKDTILGVLVVGLKSASTRLPAVHALSSLIRLPTLLTDAELGYIVHEVGEFVEKEPDEVEDVTTDVLSLLSSVSLIAPHHLADQILPSLFAMLPDQAPSQDDQAKRMEYWRALCALSKLCVQPTLFETLVIRLTAKLELLCSLPVSAGVSLKGTARDEGTERCAAYVHALLLTLANTLSTKVAKAQPDLDVPKYVDQLLPHLFRLFLQAAVATEPRILEDQRLLRAGARIVKLVVESLSMEQQQRFVDAVGAAFLHGQIKAVTGGEFPPLTMEFAPAQIGANARQRAMMVLFSAAHVPIRKEVSIMRNPVDGQFTLSAFLRNLVLWCDSCVYSTLQREVASELFATLVNKYTEDVSGFLDTMLTNYYPSTLGNPGLSPEARCGAMYSWVWITRGLVVQSHASALSFIDRLFALLDDEAVAWDAARALGSLVAGDEILTKRNGAVLKILHIQRYTNNVLPRVIDGARKVGGTKRETAYLIALASLVDVIPNSLYETQMPTIMPLLLRGLDVADPKIRWQIIGTLSKNINAFSNDELLSTYASTLVVTMLKNCTIMNTPEHKVRVAALKYLALLPSAVRYDLLHPYKPRVLKELAKALDDPKRAVRKEAVDARTKWSKYTG